MSKLQVTFAKLKKYIEQQGGYDLEHRGDRITLSFVPAFPEALEKGWESISPPRLIMHGRLANDKITFDLIQVEEDNKIRNKELDVAEFTYKSWLQYIEDNY